MPSPHLCMGSGWQMKEEWSCCFFRLIKKAFDQQYITLWVHLVVKTHKVVFGMKTFSAQPQMWCRERHIKSWLAFASSPPGKSRSTPQLCHRLSHILVDAVTRAQAPSEPVGASWALNISRTYYRRRLYYSLCLPIGLSSSLTPVLLKKEFSPWYNPHLI